MSPELWFFAGTVLVSLITMAGVIYSAKVNIPSTSIKALKDTVDALSAENTRLSEKVEKMRERIDELEAQVKKYEEEGMMLYSRLGRRQER